LFSVYLGRITEAGDTWRAKRHSFVAIRPPRKPD
jgi:hypothetical protein